MSSLFSSRLRLRCPGQVQRGQAMIEYLLVTAAVAIVMFIPTPVTNGMSLADFLARAVRAFFRGYSFMVSVS